MITQRQEKLLEKIIKEFVATAQPVSSKLLEESGNFGLSSATLRSEMNELERAGYLEQPHTSAGRIPTDKAYRFYVDKVVKREPAEIGEKDKRKIDATIHEAPQAPREVNRSIAQILSELSENLVITNIVEEEDFFKIGLKNLFEFPEFHEFNRMFRLTSFFEEFSAIWAGGSASLHSGDHDIQVFIGHESPFRNANEEAIICAEYKLPNNFTGSVIMVGPTRMNYRRNMGLVKYTADELNELYG